MSGFVVPILVAAVGLLALLLLLVLLLGHLRRLARSLVRLRRSTMSGIAPLVASAAAIRARREP
ncbi:MULTISPECIES: hypothetical protein [unclassified Pseudonocardia]|uniref:hypothetical protein n=1 Tax=unclassified Pseudonocardia TaxID=2619320 RepID=UPI003101327C